MVAEPKSLQQAIQYFADHENCRRFLVSLRWPDGRVTCPQCGSGHVAYLENARLWKCYGKHPKAKFSIKTGTVMEDSPISLDKWLCALWLLVNCKNGVSSCEVARDLGITQKSAWFMMHRLRFVLHRGSFEKMLSGEVEADETWIGGKARNMHKSRKAVVLGGKGGGPVGKVAVQGLLARHGKEVRLRVIGEAKRKPLLEGIHEHVESGSSLYTDDAVAYYGIEGYLHGVINHAEKYVDGRIHTNGLENFWSLLKRGINGTYISVEPFHLFRYLDEQAYRYNNRKDLNDFDRFRMAASKIVGKRLTWDRLTGKQADQQTAVN